MSSYKFGNNKSHIQKLKSEVSQQKYDAAT